MLCHHLGQIQGSGRLVGVGQGDLVALSQVERSGQGQHHGLQRQCPEHPFVMGDGVPALTVPRVQMLGQDVRGQEAPGGRSAKAVVLIEGSGQVGGDRLGVPACEGQAVVT